MNKSPRLRGHWQEPQAVVNGCETERQEFLSILRGWVDVSCGKVNDLFPALIGMCIVATNKLFL